MEKIYTTNEVLEITINQLGAIAVPRSLNEQIGVPIDRAINNLRAVYDALNKQPDEAAAAAEEEEEEETEKPDENA